MTMTVAQTGQSITFTGDTSGKSGASNTFTVDPGAASKLVFTTPSRTTKAGMLSDTITIQRQDPYGNPNTADPAVTVDLSSDSLGTYAFKDTTGTTTITSVTISQGSSYASFKYVDGTVGTPTITAADHAGVLTSATQQETVNPAGTTTTAKLSAPTVRLWDLVTLSATVTGNSPADGNITGSVDFWIGSVFYGSANLVPIPPDGSLGSLATLIVQVNNSTPPIATYTVKADFNYSTNPNYSTSQDTSQRLTVVQREAGAFEATGFYTGDVFAWTTGQSSSTATVTLATTIKDYNIPEGDVRAAKVTFYFVNGSTLTPISSAKNLPVGLVDITDGTVGTASAIVQLNIGSNNALGFLVAVGISGGYKNDPLGPQSQTIVIVAKPIPGGFLVGGGALLNSNSKGLIAGANGQLTNFEFDVQYNKSQTNPQGKIYNITIRSYYKRDGTLDTKLHVYSVKSTAISVLAVNLPKNGNPGNATFSSKANVLEITDPSNPISIDSGTALQITVTDGSPDKLAITLQKKSGGLWFSSNWKDTKTIEQAIQSGGEISVH
jgi:hypothetical protein